MDPTPATTGTPERGEYLVDHVLVCGVCHTPSLDNGDPDPKPVSRGQPAVRLHGHRRHGRHRERGEPHLA